MDRIVRKCLRVLIIICVIFTRDSFSVNAAEKEPSSVEKSVGEGEVEEEHALAWEEPIMEAVTSIWFSRKSNADTTYKPTLRFCINEYEEIVDLDVGQQFSYADLVNFPALRNIHLCINQPEYSSLSVMPHLESITIINYGKKVENLDFLRGRTNLEELTLDSMGFFEVSDVGVLKSCTELECLSLDTREVTDFSFLTYCSKIKRFSFYGSAKPDFKFLPEAEYVHIPWVKYHRNEEGELVLGKG